MAQSGAERHKIVQKTYIIFVVVVLIIIIIIIIIIKDTIPFTHGIYTYIP
jgi:hypothetical protein